MNVRRIDATPIRIPFRRSFGVADATLSARCSVLIQVHGDDGHVGLGEASLEPTAGGEAIGEILQAIAAAQTQLANVGERTLEDVCARLEAVPSSPARAGLEMACYDLVTRAAGMPLARLLGSVARARVPVNAIIDQRDAGAAAAAARHLVAHGFRCLKLKVSREIAVEVARLAAVRDAVGPAVQLRIDANSAWSVAEAVAAIPRLAVHGLEYVEQPVADLADLARVRSAVATPIAADECVTGAGAVDRIAAARVADWVIVKPGRIGLRAAAAVVRRAHARGLGVVVTSMLDSSVGIAAALHLAATLPDPIWPCGLATASLLAGDLAVDPLVPHDGWLEVPQGPGLGVRLDSDALRRWCLPVRPV